MRALVRLTLGLIVVLSAAPAAAGKLGFLDAQRAVVTVQEGKSQLQVLDDWAKPQRDHLEQLKQQVDRLPEQLVARRRVTPNEPVEQLQDELLQAQRELEDQAREFNREWTARREKILGEVAAKIGTLAAEYAQANDFDVVFLIGAQPLAYYSKTLDITDIVIGLYDERYPVK